MMLVHVKVRERLRYYKRGTLAAPTFDPGFFREGRDVGRFIEMDATDASRSALMERSEEKFSGENSDAR